MRKNDEMVEKIREIMYEEMGVEPRIKVFAFGGAGGRMAEYIASRGITGVKVIAVNVDEKVGGLKVDKKMRLGKEVMGIHSDTAGEAKVAEYVISRSEKLLRDEIDSADAVVLIGALGGGMGTGGMIETMRMMKRTTTKPMMAFVIMPFSVEKERRARALEALELIKREELGTYVIFDSDELLKFKDMSITTAYNRMYSRGASMVRQLADFTAHVLKEKFESIYLRDLPEIVESKAAELESNAIYA
ncbi:MAG: cell division protein FtsZ [Euryarchaeota archaeon]|nr:cell division protein FtsZ [Euryarchaeota archaeon]